MTRAGVLLALLAGGAATVAIAGVRASLDTSQIAAGDTVQLTLEHDGRTSGQPDLTPLEQDFDILGTSSSTSFELFNSSASEKSQVILTLAPKVTGRLTIPALSWDGERSQPLSLIVTGPGIGTQPGSAAATSAAKVFIQTNASPRQPYVEAAVQLTVRLFTSETLYHADLELPGNGDVLVKQIGSDQNSEVERSGRSYQVVTRHYLLFPLHSGRLALPGPVLDAEMATSPQRSPFGSDPFGGAFFGGPLLAGPIRVYGDPVVLMVRPRPAGAVGSYWLPARDVTLSSAWNPAQVTAQAGDPLTLDVDLQATGLTAAQLPDIASLLNMPAGLKAYPDQPKLNDSMQGGTLIGSRDQTIALMADSPGHYTIPALTVTWWDTQTNRPRFATLPARTLTILPAPGSTVAGTAAPANRAAPITAPGVAAAPAAATASAGSRSAAAPRSRLSGASRNPAPARSAPRLGPSEPGAWEWISIALALMWLSTLIAWLWSRRSRAATRALHGGGVRTPTPSLRPRQTPPDASRERAAFRAACEANDAHAARTHLLAWTAAVWGTAPAGIGAIAATIHEATVAELLRDLDRACYAGGVWQGQPLAAALNSLPTPSGKNGCERNGLAPLYP
ncbi:MAG: BatD family protein [Steroidobacteraceae bacterium]